MNLKKTALIMVALVCICITNAQDGFTAWERDYLENNATPKQHQFICDISLPSSLKFTKAPPPKFGMNKKQAWDACLKRCLAAFFTEPKAHKYNMSVALVYGLFNLGNFDSFEYRPALKRHFSDTAKVEESFKVLLPMIKQSWMLLDNESQQLYGLIIYHAENYIKIFNYQKELEYYNTLVILSKKQEFIEKGYNCKEKNGLRKAEAFIFRRIYDSQQNKGNWSVGWMRKMVKLLKQGLMIA